MSKKSRSNTMKSLKYFPTQIWVFFSLTPPTPQRELSLRLSLFHLGKFSSHITDQWAVVVGLLCGTGSVSGTRSGFGYAAYFSSTHPPVSGAPSNVELRVVRFGNVIPFCLFDSRFGSVRFSCLLLFDFRECAYEFQFKMTDFHMNDILRSFRKMRMNRNLGQGNPQQQQHHHRHHHHRPHQYQPINSLQHYDQQSKLLKKIIKILKKTVIKQKVTRKMNIIV